MGKRGEGWVLVQFILFIALALSPFVLPQFSLPGDSIWFSIVGGGLMLVGAGIAAAATLRLGTSLSALPKPKAGGRLVTGGIYSIVRHPIYSGATIAAFGWSIFNANVFTFLLAVALFVFFDLKSRREELWLMETYDGYREYRARVKRLIPWLY